MFDTMTLTKVAGALCGALLIFLLGKWAAEELYHTKSYEEAAYVIEVADTGAGAEVVETVDFGTVLASADIESGAKVFKKCSACHKLEAGANETGPYLYGVVGREKAAAQGFSYSATLAGLGGEWTAEDLNGFLEKPADYAPGTTMKFAGLKKVQDRADVIAYLESLDN